jgi:hypothetical protein
MSFDNAGIATKKWKYENDPTPEIGHLYTYTSVSSMPLGHLPYIYSLHKTHALHAQPKLSLLADRSKEN